MQSFLYDLWDEIFVLNQLLPSYILIEYFVFQRCKDSNLFNVK